MKDKKKTAVEKFLQSAKEKLEKMTPEEDIAKKKKVKKCSVIKDLRMALVLI